MATATSTRTTGEQALNLALNAGFEVERHGIDYRREYVHVLNHTDGRRLVVKTALSTGRLLRIQGYNRDRWNTARLAVRSLPALARLLAA